MFTFMKKIKIVTSLLIVTIVTSFSANATLISLDIADVPYQVGDAISANIVVSEIESDSGFNKLLANFELALSFDSSLVSVEQVTFGDKLDVDWFFPSDQFTNNGLGGLLTLSEITYAFSEDLYLAQDGLSSFVLATITFSANSAGSLALSFVSASLGDEFGGFFTEVSTEDSNLVIASATAVSEPPVIALLLLPLVAMLRRRAAVN